MNTPQHIGTIHLSPIHLHRRSFIRTTGPLFNPSVLHHLAAKSVLHHIPDASEPADAMRWSIALAGLAFSKDAAA
jgi:hypothetical protein